MFKVCTLLFCSLLFFFFVSTASSQEFSLDNKNSTPGGSPNSSEGEVEIHYDTDNTSGVGAPDTDFIIAARYTITQTAGHIGENITKVRVFIRDATVGNTATLRIYSAGTSTTPGAEVYNQTFATTSLAWHEVTLTTPVQVPNADIWVGVQALAGPTGVQFWGGTDAGPHHVDGQFIFFNGAWATLVALNPALTFNWNIRAVVQEVVPVELSSFTASVGNGLVNLKWQTATETNNYGFEVQRSVKENEFVTVGFVAGNGTTTEVNNYSFIDNNITSGAYSYRLKQVDLDGTFEFSNEVEVDVNQLPSAYSLNQNYPNPFNPSTKIDFNLPVESNVTLKIFNVIGQEVLSLINGNLNAGFHNFDFNASNFNSGVYFYSLEAQGIDGSNFSEVKKMLLTK